MVFATVPAFVRASFLVSGILQIPLESLPSVNGGLITIQNDVKLDFAYPTVHPNSQMSKDGNDKNNSCGPGQCSEKEMCVTWMKETNDLDEIKDSPVVLHECLPDDGVHWNKMSPTGGKLCEDGKTHSILKQNQQPCLRKQPPCQLIWKYVCVNEEDSPHNCKLKKCPNGGGCVEMVSCGLEPPCFKEATCIPDFIFMKR